MFSKQLKPQETGWITYNDPLWVTRTSSSPFMEKKKQKTKNKPSLNGKDFGFASPLKEPSPAAQEPRHQGKDSDSRLICKGRHHPPDHHLQTPAKGYLRFSCHRISHAETGMRPRHRVRELESYLNCCRDEKK